MKKLMIFIGVIALLLASFLFIPKTTTNYDMTIYLPDSSGTKQGLEIIKEEFEQESTIQILVMDVTPTNLLSLMETIALTSHVKNIIWLDDYVDLSLVPIEFIDAETLSPFYQDGDALITIIFDTDAYDITLDDSVNDIKSVLSDYEISKIIESNTGDGVITALISEVKVKGAPDNITIIWAQVTDKKVSSEIKKLGAANE